jgi:hypothetical protein
VDYDSQAGDIDLGTPAALDLFVHLKPFYTIEENQPADSRLPSVTDLNGFLEWVEDGIGGPGGCIDYVAGQTIGSAPHTVPAGYSGGWVEFNVGDDCGGLNFLRIANGVDAHSQNHLMLDRSNVDLYDPKYDDATAQFIIASSFGLMQTTMLFMSEYTNEGLRFLDEEWDIRADDDEKNYLNIAKKPWRSLQTGTFHYKYNLYNNTMFPFLATCGENCDRESLLQSARAGLCRYNGQTPDSSTGHCPYVDLVFEYLDEYSSQLDRWGLP